MRVRSAACRGREREAQAASASAPRPSSSCAPPRSLLPCRAARDVSPASVRARDRRRHCARRASDRRGARGGRLGKARHHALHAHVAQLAVGHAHDRLARGEMRIGENVGDVVDRREADLVRVQAARAVRPASAARSPRPRSRRAPRDSPRATGCRRSARRSSSRCSSSATHSRSKMLCVDAAIDAQRPSRGRVDVAGRGVLAAVARAVRTAPSWSYSIGEEIEHAQHRLGHRAVDLLAALRRVVLAAGRARPARRARRTGRRPRRRSDSRGAAACRRPRRRCG